MFREPEMHFESLRTYVTRLDKFKDCRYIYNYTQFPSFAFVSLLNKQLHSHLALREMRVSFKVKARKIVTM
jgi:hypothetical protein